MEEYKSTYPSDEKLKSSTSIKVTNNSNIPASIEEWTCGFVFLVDTVNLKPTESGSVKAEYVWYDFRAKDMSNKVIASISGVYFNKHVYLSGPDSQGLYHLSTK